MAKRVRAGSRYRFDPCLMDVCDPRTQNVVKGDVVKVVNLHGCPPANTMGMCHIEKDGAFAGLVCTASLEPV